MNKDKHEKVREDKLGRKANQRGLIRVKDGYLNEGRGYMLVHADTNTVEYGENFNLSLDDVETYLADQKKPPGSELDPVRETQKEKARCG